MIVFGDMISYIIINKKLNIIVTEVSIKCRKLKIYFVVITQ